MCQKQILKEINDSEPFLNLKKEKRYLFGNLKSLPKRYLLLEIMNNCREVQFYRNKTVGKKSLMEFDGFTFHVNKKNLYHCSQEGCPVYVRRTDDNKYFYCNKWEHEHDFNLKYFIREERNAKIEEVLNDPRNQKKTPSELATIVIDQCNDNITVKSLSNQISQKIKKMEEEEVKTNIKEKGLFKLVSQDDMIIYGNPKCIEKFQYTKILFVDGTFKVCPKNWYQLYTFHGLVDNKRTTFFYCLLKNKERSTYEKMFKEINTLTHGLAFTQKYTLMGDFEILLFDFLGNNVVKKCCQFHFCQCIERKAKKIIYKSKEEKKKGKKLKKELMSLSICPRHLVKDMFDRLKEKYKDYELIKYFETNYISDKKDGCPIDYWNVSEEQHRTNNFSESFNREIRHYFTVSSYFRTTSKPSIEVFESTLFQYIDYLEKNQKLKRTRRRNIVLECKNELIKNINKYHNLFKSNELFIVLKSIMAMGKHKAKKRIDNTITEEDSDGEEVFIDEEYFETKKDEDIDNIDDEDGIGNDIEEIKEEINKANRKKEEDIQRISFTSLKEKMEENGIIDSETNELLLKSVKETFRNENRKDDKKPKINKKGKEGHYV